MLSTRWVVFIPAQNKCFKYAGNHMFLSSFISTNTIKYNKITLNLHLAYSHTIICQTDTFHTAHIRFCKDQFLCKPNSANNKSSAESDSQNIISNEVHWRRRSCAYQILKRSCTDQVDLMLYRLDQPDPVNLRSTSSSGISD